MSYAKLFVKNRVGNLSRQSYRPLLEHLEDRCLLSGGFAPVILASDVPGVAPITDPNLVNPWGLSFSPTGPFWIAENGSNVSDVIDGRGQLVPLVVSIPSAAQSGGTPTGTVFNAGPGFVISKGGASAPSRFLFANEDGTIAGWSAKVDSTSAILAIDNSTSGAVYTGLAFGGSPSGDSFLYAADFGHGTIDVFDQHFRPIIDPNAFQDVSLPTGFAPFNIQNIANLLFVTYAQRGTDPREAISGAGQGFIDVYHSDGSWVGRFASQGALNSPWGLAFAPEGFGQFGGALLVGNNGDGLINAYDLNSGTFIGELQNSNGVPITIPNLWALIFGNDHAGGNSDTLFFAAGTADNGHGFFGAIQAPGNVGSDTAGSGVFDNHGPGEPGDYPLPPSGGPALRAIREDQVLTNSDLLPLKESSLVLVPTISNISLPNGGAETPVLTLPSNGGSLAGPMATDMNSITANPKSSEEGTPLGRVVSTDASSLFAFLDLNGARTDIKVQGRADATPFDIPMMTSEGRDVELRAISPQIAGYPWDRQLIKVMLSNDLPIQSEANENIDTYSDVRTAPANEGMSKNNSIETKIGADWANFFWFLFSFSIPIIWGQWLNNPRDRNPRDTMDRNGIKL
jgi:uncharacterized protein (TIGR03118 family)